MRVLFVSGREPAYVRSTLLLRALQASFDVVQITSCARSTTARYLEAVCKIAWNRPSCDVAVAGFFGQPLVPILRLLHKSPVVLDAFVSAYDTLCFDRQIVGPSSPGGKMAYWLDKSALSLSSQVVTDTKAHARYFAKTFEVPSQKISPLYLGYDSRVFFPRTEPNDGRFLVFFYGTFLPVHGIEYIVKAAKLVQNESDIRFLIVGKGKGYADIRKLANNTSAQNIDFMDWIPYEKLPQIISQASICLGGHFSNVDKATRVISGKTYQFLAMQKPTIVGDCPATEELFQHREHAYACKQANEFALADAILELKRDRQLRDHIARNGRELVASLFDDRIVAANVRRIVESAIH